MERDVDHIGCPHLIHSRAHADIHQAAEAPSGITWDRVERFLVDRPSIHAAHEVSHPVAADRNPISGQVAHHPEAASAAHIGG